MTSIIEIILQEFGWEKGWEILARMTGNADFDSTSNPFIIYDAGILISDVIHGLQFMQQFPSYDFEFRIPINEAIIQGNPIAIGGKTSNQAAAEAFIDFILSTDGQKQWLREDVNQLPIQESAFNTDIGNDRTDLYNYYNQTIENLINYNESLANSYKYSIYYYYQSVDFNAHTRLVDCWKLLLDYYYADPVGHKAQFETWAAEMAAPVTIVDPYTGNTEVFDVDYAKSINKLIQTDNDYRILVMEEWRFASYPLPWPPLCLTKR